MLKLIENDAIDGPVKQFLNGLEISEEPSVIEADGRRVYILVRPGNKNGHADEPWTLEKNKRRHELIEKQFKHSITPAETIELADLDESIDRWIDEVAPLPFEYPNRLLEQLMAKKLMHQSNGPSAE